jgi:hypothetical protein
MLTIGQAFYSSSGSLLVLNILRLITLLAAPPSPSKYMKAEEVL